MTKFIEHLHSNIVEIASNNLSNNENNFEESFQNSLDEISNFMQNIDFNNDITLDVIDSLKSKFNDLVQNGVSPKEAYKESFETLSDILNSSISNESLTNISNNDEDHYDLSFANSSVNDKSLLIDDAISQGMSVEEAIRFVNNQVNPSKSEEFGPSNIADSGNFNTVNEMLTKSEDEINLDKIEADMDEQANKVSVDKSDHTDNSSTIDTYNENLEDDDIS
ncbi:MAG: hypothetical protein ACJ0G4_07605 [Alphaproteobacteria bacterium]